MAADNKEQVSTVRRAKHGGALTVLFTIISILWIAPILIVILNSFKRKAFIFRYPFGISTAKITEGWSKFAEGAKRMELKRQISFRALEIRFLSQLVQCF